MRLLAFDTSTPAVTVALRDGDRCVERTVVDARRHGELLAPLIREVLGEAAVRPAELAAVAVGLGPGPFTGLRVGVATAAAMSAALGIPAYGVCSLDVLAAACAGDAAFGVATDARRREVYWAVYCSGAQRKEGPRVTAPAVAANAMRDACCAFVTGDGAMLYPDAFAALVVADGPRYPQAHRLAAVVAPRVQRGEAPDALRPLYLRRPDAAPPGARKAVLRA